MSKIFFKTFAAALLAVTSGLFTACSDNTDPTNDGNTIVKQKGQFFVAVRGTNADYIMQAKSLESGELNINDNVYEMKGIDYAWTFRDNIAIGMSYQQQNPGLGFGGKLLPDTTLTVIGEMNIPSRFTNYGLFNNYLITSVCGLEFEGNNDGAQFQFWDLDKDLSNTQTKTFHTEPIAANGEQVTFSGIVDTGNGEFLTSMIKSSFHQTGTGNGSSVGDVAYPDSVWVAAFDKDMNLKRIYKDDRISYSAGQYRSQVFSQMGIADDGTTYVFSGSYDSNSTRNAGALRIKKGATTFDPDYYFDIETKTGGYHFRRVWHLTGNKFIIEIYKDIKFENTTPANQFAILDMETKDLKWVTGLPDKNNIRSGGDSGSIPLYHEGNVYIPIWEYGNDPAVYIADVNTAVAHKGATIKGSSGIRALGFLKVK